LEFAHEAAAEMPIFFVGKRKQTKLLEANTFLEAQKSQGFDNYPLDHMVARALLVNTF
jgi:hypothetical protein